MSRPKLYIYEVESEHTVLRIIYPDGTSEFCLFNEFEYSYTLGGKLATASLKDWEAFMMSETTGFAYLGEL